MKNKLILGVVGFFLTLLFFPSCKDSEAAAVLSIGNFTDTIPQTGGKSSYGFTSNASWSIDTTNFKWLHVSPVSGNGSSDSIHLSAGANSTASTRSLIVTIVCENGQERRITVVQSPCIYPDYNTNPIAPDVSGMNSTATQLVAKMKLGVNLGNTLELVNICPAPNKNYFSMLKSLGFNSVRIPCGWYMHGANNATANIPQSWMDSVKTVVQWCVDNDMYVMLNIHWDGGWLEDGGRISAAKKDSVIARQTAYWQQIATGFRDFDEHLFFASANEPYKVNNDAEAAILVSYHQACIDAVRSTGGRNAYRSIAIQGPEAFIKPSAHFPKDATPNRLIYECHNYTPSNFTIMDKESTEGGWGGMFFYWGAGNHSTLEPSRNSYYGEEGDIAAYFQMVKKQYIDKGVPCLLGEYAALQRRTAASNPAPLELDKHNKSVDDWYTYLTKQSLAIGAPVFFWEQGNVFDRTTNAIIDQRTVDAILAGSK